MGFYDAMKDAVNLAQKADNIELYRQLLDLSAQALDLQEENRRLKEEIADLRKGKDLESKIIRYKQTYLTLQDDDKMLKYCAVCWDSERKLIQMGETVDWHGERAKVYCKKCENVCLLD